MVGLSICDGWSRATDKQQAGHSIKNRYMEFIPSLFHVDRQCMAQQLAVEAGKAM
jgi:hypothetical protein